MNGQGANIDGGVGNFALVVREYLSYKVNALVHGKHDNIRRMSISVPG